LIKILKKRFINLKKNISLICFNLTKNTDKMFKIFENENNSQKEKNHSINKDLFGGSFIQTIGDLFDNNFKRFVEKNKKSYKDGLKKTIFK